MANAKDANTPQASRVLNLAHKRYGKTGDAQGKALKAAAGNAKKSAKKLGLWRKDSSGEGEGLNMAKLGKRLKII